MLISDNIVYNIADLKVTYVQLPVGLQYSQSCCLCVILVMFMCWTVCMRVRACVCGVYVCFLCSVRCA